MSIKTILIGAAVIVGGVIVYRRVTAKTPAQATTTTLTGAARNVVDSGKAAIASVTAFAAGAPGELGAGGTLYGTKSSTDVARLTSATRFVQADEINRTYAQNVMLGLDGGTKFRA